MNELNEEREGFLHRNMNWIGPMLIALMILINSAIAERLGKELPGFVGKLGWVALFIAIVMAFAAGTTVSRIVGGAVGLFVTVVIVLQFLA